MNQVPKAIIHLENLFHNLRLIRGSLPAGTEICLPVKANAYGTAS